MPPANRPICQICEKTGHMALDCYHRFDFLYQGRHPPAELAAMVVESNAANEHQVWYADSVANAHITSEAEKLTHQQPFNGQDTVTVGNGFGLLIKSTGSTSLKIGQTNFNLKNVFIVLMHQSICSP